MSEMWASEELFKNLGMCSPSWFVVVRGQTQRVFKAFLGEEESL